MVGVVIVMVVVVAVMVLVEDKHAKRKMKRSLLTNIVPSREKALFKPLYLIPTAPTLETACLATY